MAATATKLPAAAEEPRTSLEMVTGNVDCVRDEVHRLFRACAYLFGHVSVTDLGAKRAIREAREAYADAVEYLGNLDEAIDDFAGVEDDDADEAIEDDADEEDAAPESGTTSRAETPATAAPTENTPNLAGELEGLARDIGDASIAAVKLRGDDAGALSETLYRMRHRLLRLSLEVGDALQVRKGGEE